MNRCDTLKCVAPVFQQCGFKTRTELSCTFRIVAFKGICPDCFFPFDNPFDL